MIRRRLIQAGLGAALGAGGRARAAARSGELIDTTGARFELARLQAQRSLLTFGFTRCTTTCPYSLAQAALALRAPLGAPELGFVFVTLDPLSDDVPTLAKFLARFDRRILGVTGEPARIENLAERLKVSVRGRGARLEHSSVWYLLEPGLNLNRVLPSHSSAADLAGAFAS